MAKCLVSLGSNLGDRAGLLRRAVEAIQAIEGVQVRATSSLHETLPAGGPANQDSFLNSCLTLETRLAPTDLYRHLAAIENQLGRERLIRWDARLIDIDLLLYDELVIKTPQLVVPHPRMAFRRFVLEPAIEIAANMQHPLLDRSLQQLMDHLNQARDYLALTGSGAYPVFDRLSASDYELASERSPPIAANRPIKSGAELQQHRVQTLRQVDWDHCQRFVVSDFWLGEAQIGLAATQTPWAADSVETTEPSAPKLLVLVEHPTAELSPLRTAVTHSACGPYLLLDAQNVDNAVQEVEGALLSMKQL